MAKKTKKRFKSNLKLEALEQRQLLAGITGSGTELTPGGSGADKFIVAANGNHYDQVLLTGTSVTVTNDAGNITRVSFLDLQGDIVQAEFGGAGTLTISLDPSTAVANVDPVKYNQTGVKYEQGLASFTISGSDATTNFSVFSVGAGTAFAGNTLFDATHTGGDHTADVAKITIVADTSKPNGSAFGGIRAGNAIFSADNGVVGIAAANVQVQDVVTVGDIKTSATSTATPTLVFGTQSQFGAVTVAGGGLSEANGKSIANSGSYNFGLNFTAGADSTVAPGGTPNLPVQTPSAGLSFTGNNPIAAQVKTFTLTTGVDAITGTAGNDTINGQIGAGATLTALDSIDGGAGTDQLSINDVTGGTALPAGITIKNVETINLASAGIANIDTTSSSISGLTTLNVLASTGADTITAGSGHAVTVFDSTGPVTLTGGSTQTVTVAGGVALSKAAGAIVATDTAQGATASTIDDGTTVTLTNTAKNNGGTTGAITIGNTTKPTGAVTVSSTLVGDSTYATNTAGGVITVKGGTTDSITQAVTNPVNTVAGSNATVTEANVNVTGSASTTSVTVNQAAASTAANTVLAVAGVTEVTTVQFVGTPAAGDTIVLAGLTYTVPAGGATAKQVAAAFANLANGLTGFTTGAVSGVGSDTVTFTGTSAATIADITNGGTLFAGGGSGGLTTINTITQGVTAAKASGAAGVVPGSVTISDANGSPTTNTISSVTLSNYGASTITSNALNTLSLSNTSGATSGALTINNTVATSLDLTVNAAKGINTITDASNTYTTLKVHTTGNDTTLTGFTDTSLKSLTVDGTKKLTITTAPASLTSVTVSGSAGLSMTAGASVTDINASATSGAVTVTLDPTVATYEGGSGADNVTIAVSPTKAISGGAGADTLTLSTTALTNPSGNTNISGFETLALSAATGGATYDATGFTGVSVGSTITGGGVTFSNVAAGTPLSIAAPGQNVTYQLKTDTAADALTINVNGDASGATTTAAGIESIAISNSSNDSKLTLAASSATSITVTGSKALTLNSSGNVVLASVDASASTGALTHTTNGTVAETVKGGSAADKLTAAVGTTADVLIGGAGADTLTSNAGLTTLTGGSGNDLFVVQTKTANVNVYTTITDASTGDVLQLAAAGGTGIETFAPTKLVLGSGTAVFQDYANAVVNTGAGASANGYVGWFQFNGDTYVVEAMHAGTSFDSTQDLVVKLSGLVDLSGAGFMQNAGVPEIVIR